jgi:DNA-binding NtrC family response regulator
MPNKPSAHTHSNEQLNHFSNGLCQGPSILLVEDDDAVRAFVRLALENSGYNVVPASDGEIGSVQFEMDPERFVLVVTDVVMPNRTGPELIEIIRRTRPEMPVIFMSAYVGCSQSTPIEIPPGATLLEKPFSLDQLLQAVAQALPRVAPKR